MLEPTAAERLVARRAAESRATVPTIEISHATPAGRWGTATLLAACAAALRTHPRANASYRDGRFELYSRINLGVVLTGADGHYLIPTLFDADLKSVEQLERELVRLRSSALARSLTAPELSGATFTLWDARAQGLADASIPVLAPQAGALTAGTQALRLISDHRILYGGLAAAFLQTIAHHLDGHRA